jgi:hypothetical protein
MSFFKMGFILTALILSALANPTFAQSDDAAKQEAARQLAEFENADSAYITVIDAIINDAKRLFLQTNPDLEKEINATAVEVIESLEPEIAGLNQRITALYADALTLEEMNAIIAFYETPVGQKFNEVRPEINQNVLEETISWGDDLSSIIVQRMQQSLREKGHRL